MRLKMGHPETAPVPSTERGVGTAPEPCGHVVVAVVVVVLAAAAGCTLTQGSHQTPSKLEPRPAPVIVQARVSGRAVSTAEHVVSVAAGRRVIISVAADHADVVEVKGLGVSEPVAPNEPAVIEITAQKAGSFPVVLNDSKVKVVDLKVH
jgi:hypothetical protein